MCAFDWYQNLCPRVTLSIVVAVILHSYIEFSSFRANYVKSVEDRAYCLNRNVVQRI